MKDECREGNDEDKDDQVHGSRVKGEEDEADDNREGDAPDGQAQGIKRIGLVGHALDKDEATDGHQDQQGDREECGDG